MLKKLVKLLLVICCMIVIFLFSSDNGIESSKKSDTVIESIITTVSKDKLSKKEKNKYINKYVFLVRKIAHFTIYFILGVLVISLLKEHMILNKKTIFYTCIIIFIYALSDEVHQLFVPGRSSRFLDVIIDTCGGFVGSYLYYLFRRKKHE